MVLVLEVTASIYATAQHYHISSMLQRTISDRIHMYPNDTESARAVDFMQRSVSGLNRLEKKYGHKKKLASAVAMLRCT